MLHSLIGIHLRHIIQSKEYKLSLALIFLIATIAVIEQSSIYLDYDDAALPSAALGWIIRSNANMIASIPIFFFLVFPLLINFIYSDSFMRDRDAQTLFAFRSRASIINYVLSAYIAIIIVVGLTFVSVLLLYQLFAFILFPLKAEPFAMWESARSTFDTPSGLDFSNALAAIYVHTPYIFNIIVSLYIGIFAASYACVTYAVSLFVHTRRGFLLGGSTVIYLILNLILPLEMRPVFLLIPSIISPSPQLITYIAYPLCMLMFTVFLTYAAINKRDVCL